LGYNNPRGETPLSYSPYLGEIKFIQPKIRTWIRKHRFASEDWLIGHIRWGKWLPDKKPDHYYILINCYDGKKSIDVKVKFIYYPDSYVLVHHPHIEKRYRK